MEPTLEQATAYHEAGHAVARVLGAADFGLPAEKMISHIDVGTAENLGQSFFDKSVTLKSQAVTYGPTLSAELQAVFNRATLGVAGITGPRRSASERRMGGGKRSEPRKTYEYQKTSERP